jgi:octanoyl-[GcvH]:protein N-octanoyltransferase
MNLYQHFKSVTIIDQHADLEDQLQLDKTLASTIDLQTLIVRFWSAQGVILGKMDTMLADYDKGLKALQNAGHKTLVRKAGGLAVVCDPGILNLTIMFSKKSPKIGGLNESYEFGIQLMRHLLHDSHLDIQEGEVSNSYCPGKYDLSVSGKKIAGMAQYRSKDTVMLMVTLCVSGNQQKRCALIKNFYDIANPLNDPKYPNIDPKSMETISALTHKDFSVASIKESMIQILHKSGIPTNNQ